MQTLHQPPTVIFTDSMQAKATFPDFSFDDTAVAFSYKNNAQLRHAQALFNLINQNWLVKIGTTATPLALKLGLPIKGLVKSTIFKHFLRRGNFG